MKLGSIPGIRAVRSRLRRWFFDALRHVATIEDTRKIFSDMLYEHNAIPVPSELDRLAEVKIPYTDLQHTAPESPSGHLVPPEPVFLTGRFRSGSTMLWNLFRHIPGVTCYYEPLNEARWFDPETRARRVDPTHIGVSDYWAEYEGLDELGRCFDENWKFHHLYMPATAWNPQLQRYIELLVARARGRPVLQFNAMDFRLPWLRARFPNASIIHLFRHPRDQWCSTLRDSTQSAQMSRLREFDSLDKFYLLSWARDLRRTFPFLTLDPEAYAYELYYQVWRLSHLFGHLYANLSIAFENLVANPRSSIPAILDTAHMAHANLETLLPLVSVVPTGKWRQHGDAAWFTDVETRVDRMLSAYIDGLRNSTIAETHRRFL